MRNYINELYRYTAVDNDTRSSRWYWCKLSGHRTCVRHLPCTRRYPAHSWYPCTRCRCSCSSQGGRAGRVGRCRCEDTSGCRMWRLSAANSRVPSTEADTDRSTTRARSRTDLHPYIDLHLHTDLHLTGQSETRSRSASEPCTQCP